MTNYMDRAAEETRQTLIRVRRAVYDGYSPAEAINRNAHTNESYSAALKEYGLKPDIPD